MFGQLVAPGRCVWAELRLQALVFGGDTIGGGGGGPRTHSAQPYIYIYVYIHGGVPYIYIHMYIYVYIYIFIYRPLYLQNPDRALYGIATFSDLCILCTLRPRPVATHGFEGTAATG